MQRTATHDARAHDARAHDARAHDARAHDAHDARAHDAHDAHDARAHDARDMAREYTREVRLAHACHKENAPAARAHYERAAFIESVARLAGAWGARVRIGR